MATLGREVETGVTSEVTFCVDVDLADAKESLHVVFVAVKTSVEEPTSFYPLFNQSFFFGTFFQIGGGSFSFPLLLGFHLAPLHPLGSVQKISERDKHDEPLDTMVK